jgi:hypothetical protein
METNVKGCARRRLVNPMKFIALAEQTRTVASCQTRVCKRHTWVRVTISAQACAHSFVNAMRSFATEALIQTDANVMALA